MISASDSSAVGQLVAAALAKRARGLLAALALAPQDGGLVAVALLGGLLQLGQDQTQRLDTVPVAFLHRDDDVLLDPVGNCHCHRW